MIPTLDDTLALAVLAMDLHLRAKYFCLDYVH